MKNASNCTPEGQRQIVRHRSGWKGDFLMEILCQYMNWIQLFRRGYCTFVNPAVMKVSGTAKEDEFCDLLKAVRHDVTNCSSILD